MSSWCRLIYSTTVYYNLYKNVLLKEKHTWNKIKTNNRIIWFDFIRFAIKVKKSTK